MNTVPGRLRSALRPIHLSNFNLRLFLADLIHRALYGHRSLMVGYPDIENKERRLRNVGPRNDLFGFQRSLVADSRPNYLRFDRRRRQRAIERTLVAATPVALQD